MQVAQRLYESGKITYMRTDSVNLSQDAMNAAKSAITQNYGANYAQPKNIQRKAPELRKRTRQFDQLTFSCLLLMPKEMKVDCMI
jgi:DNA topoisomerase IA